MNKVILMGRLTKDPEVRMTQGESPMTIARYTLAVDRRRGGNTGKEGEQTADFISVVALEEVVNLQRSTSKKVLRLSSQDVFRQVLIQIRMVSRFTLLIL